MPYPDGDVFVEEAEKLQDQEQREVEERQKPFFFETEERQKEERNRETEDKALIQEVQS